MNRTKGTVLAAIAALAFAGAAKAASAADVVILDSTVSSIAAGDVVAEESPVTIPGGGSVTVILSTGETLILSGPYNGPIGEARTVEAAGLDGITATRGGETKVLGAVRAPKWDISD